MMYEILLSGGTCIGKSKSEESAHDMARYASALREDEPVYVAIRWQTVDVVQYLYRYFNGRLVREFTK